MCLALHWKYHRPLLCFLHDSDAIERIFCRKEDDADIQFAANAAAYFSKAKAEGKAEVVYALIKDLNKPKGARPGQVKFPRPRSPPCLL